MGGNRTQQAPTARRTCPNDHYRITVAGWYRRGMVMKYRFITETTDDSADAHISRQSMSTMRASMPDRIHVERLIRQDE